MRRFSRFACLDWSGAKGKRQPGIALAIAEAGDEAPVLVIPEGGWSREAVLDWLLEQVAAGADMVIGIDFSPSLPFADEGAFFPGWGESPPDAPSLWRQIDELAAGDPHLSVTGALAHPEIARHFRQVGACGDRFPGGAGRLRETERLAPLSPASCFNLVGAKQVGKSSLTGMRMLHRLVGTIPIWPFDPVPEKGPLVVEIYTGIAALEAGRPKNRTKIRDATGLTEALETLGSDAGPPLARHDDHSTDAIVTAAWLRRRTADRKLWNPPALTEDIRRTEGWTFGVQ